MKITTIITLAVLLTAVSCKKDSTTPQPKATEMNELTAISGKFSYQGSEAAWTELKKVNGNSYAYTVSAGSWLGGRSWKTDIYVENGVVTFRVYRAYVINSTDGSLTLESTYTETVGNLGSNTAGALPKTIDELYLSCSKDYLVVDATKNIITFTTAENGMYASCGFTPNLCMDDCYNGVTISSFGWSN